MTERRTAYTVARHRPELPDYVRRNLDRLIWSYLRAVRNWLEILGVPAGLRAELWRMMERMEGE